MLRYPQRSRSGSKEEYGISVGPSHPQLSSPSSPPQIAMILPCVELYIAIRLTTCVMLACGLSCRILS